MSVDNEVTTQPPHASGSPEEKKIWQAPRLKTFPTDRTEGKDFANADEATFTSGPS